MGQWVKVDIGYFDNPKVVAVPPPARCLHLASICWSAQYRTDGRLPPHMIERLCAYAGADRSHADALVLVGLWELQDSSDDYFVHDYLDYNTPSSEVEAKRSQSRDRVRRYRERQASPQVSDVTSPSSRVTSRVTDGVTNACVTPVEVEVEVDVEENIPPTPRAVALDPPRRRARRKPGVYDPEFLQWWALYPKGVGKRPAQEAWDKALQMGATPERLTAALQAALPELRKKDPQYIPHASTWLNQGRWEDETAAVLARAAPTARCFTCRKDVAKGGGCTQGEANLEYCDRKDWVTHGQVHRVPHVDGA
jgi:hypothetical protein